MRLPAANNLIYRYLDCVQKVQIAHPTADLYIVQLNESYAEIP